MSQQASGFLMGVGALVIGCSISLSASAFMAEKAEEGKKCTPDVAFTNVASYAYNAALECVANACSNGYTLNAGECTEVVTDKEGDECEPANPVENAMGYELDADLECQVTTCEDGFTLTDGVCVANAVVCEQEGYFPNAENECTLCDKSNVSTEGLIEGMFVYTWEDGKKIHHPKVINNTCLSERVNRVPGVEGKTCDEVCSTNENLINYWGKGGKCHKVYKANGKTWSSDPCDTTVGRKCSCKYE